MVQKGLSCSIVPAYYVQGVEDVACFRLSAHPAWTVSACYRRNRYLSKSASISSPWPPPISVPSAPRKKRSCRNEPHL